MDKIERSAKTAEGGQKMDGERLIALTQREATARDGLGLKTGEVRALLDAKIRALQHYP